ncbi:MAG: enoyl-CoA hydratase-related protein [Gemmatimonadota bacterium]
MKAGVLRVEADEGILRLWLNRPEKRNALNAALVEALAGALRDAESRSDIRVILLQGEGPDFCAGADLADLERITGMGAEASLADAQRLGSLLLQMRRHPRPIVAAVQGRALAGGCGLATACDLILASEEAEFGYPEVRLGFVPAMVMAILREKLTEGRAFELVTLGSPIPAAEALRIGLVNRVFPFDGFGQEVDALVGELAKRPPEAITLTKSLLYELADLTIEDGIQRGAEVNVEARMSEACRAGVRRFLSRNRTPSS